MEVDVLVIDERELEPVVTVRVLGTGDEIRVPIGRLVSSSGDIEIYRNADEILK